MRIQLNRRKPLGVNRHARKAVREYYGYPNATHNVANRLIEWKNGDMVGTFAKRDEWRNKTWRLWDKQEMMHKVWDSMTQSVDGMLYGGAYRHGKSRCIAR